MAINHIERPISPEPFSNFKRIGRLENFVITADLEMIQQIRIIKLNKDGTPLLDKIQADPSLTAQRKQDLMQSFGDKLISKETKDAFVNAMGQVVPAETPGAFPQSQFFQQITLGMLKAQGVPIDDDTRVLELLYTMLAKEIDAIDARGEL